MELMNGQAFVKAFVPMPGGTEEVWQASGTSPYYRHADWLGSSRFASTMTRTMYNDLAYAPYGEPYAQSGGTGVTDISFAGNDENTTINAYDAMFREYGIQGRWPSPDPAGFAAANPTNPQSWNRYAYVLNNPLNFLDPLGLEGGGSKMSCQIDDVTFFGDICEFLLEALTGGSSSTGPGNPTPPPCQGYVGSDGSCYPGPPPPQSPLRPPTQQQYNACMQQAASTLKSALISARGQQAVGGLLTLIGIGTAPIVFSDLAAEFNFKTVEGVFNLGHAGGFAYFGALGPLGFGGGLYVKGTFAVANAWNQYYANTISCAASHP